MQRKIFFAALAGVRIQGKVTLFVDGTKCAEDTGELQLTKYGISGIPVFQVSRYASEGLYRKKEKGHCSLGSGTECDRKGDGRYPQTSDPEASGTQNDRVFHGHVPPEIFSNYFKA